MLVTLPALHRYKETGDVHITFCIFSSVETV